MTGATNWLAMERIEEWQLRYQKHAIRFLSNAVVGFAALSFLKADGRPCGILTPNENARRRRRASSAPGAVVEEEVPIAHAVEITATATAAAAPAAPPAPPAAPARSVGLGPEGCEQILAALRAQRRAKPGGGFATFDCVLRGDSEDGESFPAHAALLGAVSPYLAERLGAPAAERDPGAPPLITLEGVENAVLARVLDYCYGTLVRLTEHNVEPLLELSSRLGVARLSEECCAFIAQRTMPCRACRVLALADRHACTLLRRDVLLCCLRHFDEASGRDVAPPPPPKGGSAAARKLAADAALRDPSAKPRDRAEARDGFAALPRHLLVELLGDDRLCAVDEAVVFTAATDWLDAAPADRGDAADAVLGLVRFALIDPEFLCDVVEPHARMRSPACRALVHDAYRELVLPPDRRSVALRTCHPVACDAWNPTNERAKIDDAPPRASPARSVDSELSTNPFLAAPAQFTDV